LWVLVQGGELVVEGADGDGGLPRLEGGAELAQPPGAGGVAGLVELVGGVGGERAGVVEVAVVQLNGGEVGEEYGMLLDCGACELV